MLGDVLSTFLDALLAVGQVRRDVYFVDLLQPRLGLQAGARSQDAPGWRREPLRLLRSAVGERARVCSSDCTPSGELGGHPWFWAFFFLFFCNLSILA